MRFGGRHQSEAILLLLWLRLPASPVRAAGFPAAVFQVPGRAWAPGFQRVGDCRTRMCGVTRGVSVSWSLEHTQGGIFLESRGVAAASPQVLLLILQGAKTWTGRWSSGTANGARKRTDLQQGFTFCVFQHILARQTLSRLMSLTHCFRNGWMKSNI